MASIQSLTVKIGANIAELTSAMSKVQSSVQKTGERMSQLGKTISTRVTAPLTALAGVAVRSFGIQEKAELQLRAALQANGREVDRLFTRYNEFAREMQRVTVVGDETTLAMLAQAESFGLSADSAERAVRNSIAMQSAFGVNAQSALRYTAALEEGNATMLTRYIPSLRDITDESERVAEAQRILTNAFSSAEAEAQGSTGQIIQMKNAVGDLMESFGEIIAEAILPFVRRIKELAEQFQGLDRITKEQIIILGGLAAAAGPVVLGLGKITLAVRSLTAAMMANPYMAVAAGILAIGTHVFMVNRRLSRMNQLVEEALNMVPTGTRDEIDKLNQAIVHQEELIERITKQHESMGVIGSEASEKQLAPMREVLNQLIRTRDEAAALQLQGIIDEKESEKAGNVQTAVSELRQEVERFKNAIKPDTEIFDLAEELDLRRQREEFREFNDALWNFSQQDFSDPIVKLEDSIETMTRSFSTFEGIAVQTFDRLVFSGERFSDILKSIARQLASRALMKALPLLLPGGGGLSAVGGFGGFLKSIFVDDALITSNGQVVKFHPDDNILAMKDFSGLGGGTQKVEVFGTIKGEDIFISSERGGNAFAR